MYVLAEIAGQITSHTVWYVCVLEVAIIPPAFIPRGRDWLLFSFFFVLRHDLMTSLIESY